MSTQDINTTELTNVTDLEKTIKEYKDKIDGLRRDLDDIIERDHKLYFDYITEKFLSSYKHIESNEYLDFEKLMDQYNCLFHTFACCWYEPFEYLCLDIIIKYITENYSRDVVLNWVYRIIYKQILHHEFIRHIKDKNQDFTHMYIKQLCSQDIIGNLIVLLVEFYMTTSNDENDLKIIQNYFPGFECTGNENIHKAFWDAKIDNTYKYASNDVLGAFIERYKRRT